MRYRTCLFMLSFFSFIQAYSQSHFSVGLNAGAAIPLGTFAEKKTTSSHVASGQAQAGISLNVHAAYRISNTFRVIITAGGQENKRSLQALKDGFQSSSVLIEQTDTKSWRIGKLMGGGAIRIPVSDSGRIAFTAGVQAGMCKAHVPGYSVTFTNIPGQTFYIQDIKDDGRNLPWTFCYNIRTGIALRLSKRLYLDGSLSYFYARPEETIYYPGTNGFVNSYKITHKLSTLSAEAGIEILL